MADSYSVKAILSAADSGFSSTFKKCSSVLDSIDKKISGFSFGLLTGAGQAAFSALSNGASELVGEIDDSNAAWKNFESNIKIIKGDSKETEKAIESTKKELQDFAQKTVYSSSDMASTFAQLEAVGVDSTLELVKGFGGLAAASENPQQAMKTLSTQATQMAAKPKVAWADFKLMLEQTPAGIAAVAKQMGMSTSEMVTAVQDGELATKAFFDAIVATGTSDDFTNLATEAKTVDQAMDGLKETVGNKLMPTFNLLSQKGIGAVNALSDRLAGIDGDAIADKVAGWISTASAWIKKGEPYWIQFKAIVKETGNVLKEGGTFLAEHSDTLKKVLPWVLKLAVAYKGFKVVSTVVSPVASFTKSIAGLAGKGLGAIAGKLFGISAAQQEVGRTSMQSGVSMVSSAKAYALLGVAVLTIAAGFAILAFSAIQLANSGGTAIGVMAGLVVAVAALGVGMAFLLKMLAPMSGQLIPVAAAMLAMGAAVLLVSAGFALLAYSSIQLANSGGLAIGIMVGMVAAIALLAVGAAALAPALTAGAVGFIAFGGAIALVGVGALLAAASVVVLSMALPAVIAYGADGAAALKELAVGLLAFAGSAALAGAGALLMAVGFVASAVGVVALSTAMMLFAAGSALAAAGLDLLTGALENMAASGGEGGLAVAVLGVELLAFSTGAMAAGAASLVLAAGLALVTIEIVAISAAVMILAAGANIIAASMTLAVANMAILATVLPSIMENGNASAEALAALGVSVLAFSVSALAAGASALLLATGFAAVAVTTTAMSVSMTLLAAGTTIAAAGISLLSLAFIGLFAISEIGAEAMATLSEGMLVFAGKCAVTGAAALVLAVGLTAAALAITAFSLSTTAAALAVTLLGASFMVLSAGSGLAAAGLALLALQLPFIVEFGSQASDSILAIGVSLLAFAGSAAVAGAACAVLDAALLVLAVGMLALNANILIMAAGGALLSAELTLMAGALTVIVGTLPMVTLFASGTAKAFTKLHDSSDELDTSLLKVAGSFMALAAGVLAGTGSVAAFGAAMLIGAAGTVAMAAALTGVTSQMSSIARNAKSAEISLNYMQEAVVVTRSGLEVLGEKAEFALNRVKNAFNDTATKANAAGNKTGTGFANSIQPGLNSSANKTKNTADQIIKTLNDTTGKAKAAGKNTGSSFSNGMQSGIQSSKTVAATTIKAVAARLEAGRSSVYNAGACISQGFADGMLSCLSKVESAASKMASAADKAVRAKAEIHSPSKVADKLGTYWGEGYVGGILGMVKAAWNAAQELVSIPTVATSQLALSYGGELSADYDYSRKAEYNITVVSELDGREVGRGTAKYVAEENNRRDIRDSRKRGKA